MTSLWLMALLAGAALGLGVGVLLYVTAAPARPALAPLMKRAGSRPAPVITVMAPAPVQRNGWSRLAAARLSRWVDVEWLNSPDADLAVIEKSRQQFLLERVGLATVGLLVVPIWGVMLWALGIELPVVIPALGSAALAVLFWLVPANRVTVAAAERRREMRYALVSYLTLVALHRAAGEGAAASLELAAVASDSWAFRRIDRQVSAALRAQRTEWQALQDLAHELQIDELARPVIDRRNRWRDGRPYRSHVVGAGGVPAARTDGQRAVRGSGVHEQDGFPEDDARFCCRRIPVVPTVHDPRLHLGRTYVGVLHESVL